MKSKKGHESWVVQALSKEMGWEEILSFQTHEEAMEWMHSEEVQDLKELMPDLYMLSMSEKLYLQKWNSQQEIWWLKIKKEYGF